MNILVGLSGGVDSSVAAHLLLEQGHEVIGVHMQNWHGERDDPHCTADQDLDDAQQVAQQLGIELRVVDFSKDYLDRVFQQFLDEYAKGWTPNPDVLCNQEIKFKAFLNYAIDADADLIATGHYARLTQRSSHRLHLTAAADQKKDQTYFLYRLNQHQLQHACFPLGELEKSQVRAIAHQLNLTTQDKPDSTGLCFIGERNFRDFLSEYLLPKPGDIITNDGKVIGQHDGLMFYTLGQRKGLNIGGVAGRPESPWYVSARDVEHNRLVVVQGIDHPDLYARTLIINDCNWIAGEPPFPLSQTTLKAKIRYRQTATPCMLQTLEHDGQYALLFEQAQFAPAPGQSAVLYQDSDCLGGGIIQSVLSSGSSL